MATDNKTSVANFRTCEVMQYFQFMDINKEDVDILEKRIQCISNLETYCLAIHDCDTKEDGTPKDAHFHVVLTFGKSTKTAKSIGDAIGVAPQYVERIKSTTLKAQVYICHANAPEKFQYNPEIIRANFNYPSLVEKWKAQEKKEKTIHIIVDDIRKGVIREYNATKYISIEIFAKNRTLIENALRWYRMNKLTDKNRNIKVFWYEGETGTGKTTYAKMLLCEKQNLSYCLSSSSNDPLQDYKGEDVLILDDLRDDGLRFQDFIKLLDNHTTSSYSSRYSNKAFIGDIIIITTTKPLYEWFADTKEDKKQLYRRISNRFVFTEDNIDVYQFDDKGNETYLARFPNEVKKSIKKAVEDTVATLEYLGMTVSADLKEEIKAKVSRLDDNQTIADVVNKGGYSLDGTFCPF